MIRIGGKHPRDEFCMDMLYGVEPSSDAKVAGGLDRRAEIIARGEPWLQGSWEVEENFAWKYWKLLNGCRELIQSTNL